MDLAETVAALFDQTSPGVFLCKQTSSLLKSRSAVLPTILIGVGGVVAAIALSNTWSHLAALLCAILLIEAFSLRQVEFEVRSQSRCLVRRWSIPGAATILTTRRQVIDGDYVQYFLPTFSGGGLFYHHLMIVRGRRRYSVLIEYSKNREPSPTLDQTGQAVGGLLGIEYRGVETDPGFFWW